MTQIAHGEVGITVDDHGVAAALDAVDARFQRSIRQIEATDAKANIGADLSQLKRDLTAANAEIRKWESERKAAAKAEDAEAKAMAARRLGEAKKQRDAITEQITARQLLANQKDRELNLVRREEQLQRAANQAHREKTRILKENEGSAIKEKMAVNQLQQAYVKATDEAEKLHKQRKSTFGEARIKVELKEEGIRLHMEMLKKELTAIGGHPPVGIRIDTDKRDANIVQRTLFSLRGAAESAIGKLSGLSSTKINLGPLSMSIRTLVIGVTTLGPLVTSLASGLGALVGVAGTGLAGAAAIGGAALVGMGASAAGLLLTIKPLQQEFKIATASTLAYHKAVLQYGAGSKQAVTAQQKMNSVLKGVSPEVRAAAQELAKFSTGWQKLTGGDRGAKANLGHILADGLKTATALMPTLAQRTNELTKNMRAGFGGIFDQLSSKGAKSGLSTIMGNFNKAIIPAIGGLQNFGTAFGRIAVSASRFLNPTMMAFEHLGQRFSDATSNSHRLDQEVNRLASHAQSLIRFFGAAGRVMMDFFNGGAGAGQKLVDKMTAALNRWDAFMKTPKGRQDIKAFFDRGVQGTLAFTHAIAPLLKSFVEWSNALQPVTTGMLETVSAVSRLVGAFTHLSVMKGPLEVLGVTLVALFAVNKINAFINMVGNAVGALGRLRNMARGAAVAETELAVAERAAGAAGAIPPGGRAGVPGMTPGIPGGAAPKGGAMSRLGRFAGRAGTAGLVGMVAIPASQALGNAVGGNVGGAVKGAGIGASFGSAFGPIGAGIGAFGGAGVGAALSGGNIHSQIGGGLAKEQQAIAKAFDQGRISAAKAASEFQRLGSIQKGMGFDGSGKKALGLAKDLRTLDSNIGALRNGAASSLGDLRNRFNQNFTDIQRIMGTKSAQGRHEMDTNMNAAFVNLRQVLHDGRDHTSQFLGSIKQIFQTNWQATGRITKDNLNNITATIKAGMADGSISTKKGMQAIHDYAIQYLIRTLHIQPNNADVALQRGGVDSATSAGGGSVGTGGSGRPGGNAARGWIGNPGEAGPDEVPIVVGRGEAVVNRHQQPIIDYALQAIGMTGGLGELFGSVQRPHYMAEGGYADQRPRFASGGPITMAMKPHGVQGLESEGLLKAAVRITNERISKMGAAMPAGVVPASQVPGGLGVPLAGWIAQAIQWAMQRGWHSPGRLIDLAGFRTGAQQKMLHDRGESPIASGGHHEGTAYPGGAIDLPDAGSRHSLQNILDTGPYRGKLRYSDSGWGIGDTVHMSSGRPWGSTSFSRGGRTGSPKHFASGGWVTPQHWGRHDPSGSNIDQSTNLRKGQWATGFASRFGQPWEAGPSTGISTPFGNARGGYWLMHAPNGRWAVEQQTDAGPNLGLKRMFDLTGGALSDLGTADRSGFQGMFLGYSLPHGIHQGRLSANEANAIQLTGSPVKQITMWDDRDLKSASHPASYWKNLDAKYPRARAHWHTTKAAAAKIFDRNRGKSTAAAAGASSAPYAGIKGAPDYPDLDMIVAREEAHRNADDPRGTQAERDALRERIRRDNESIGFDTSLLTLYQGIKAKGYKWGNTPQDHGFIDSSITALQQGLTGLYGDVKGAQDVLGPMDLANFYGITSSSAASGGAAGGTADNADLTAQLAQANTNLAAAKQSGLISDAFAQVAGGPGSIGIGGFTSARMAAQQTDRPTIIINTLHPGDPQTLRAVANAATAGMGYQGGRTSPRDMTF